MAARILTVSSTLKVDRLWGFETKLSLFEKVDILNRFENIVNPAIISKSTF